MWLLVFSMKYLFALLLTSQYTSSIIYMTYEEVEEQGKSNNFHKVI